MMRDEDIFEVAKQLPVEDQETLVADACKGDNARKERLLRVLQETISVGKGVTVGAESPLGSLHIERPGDTIGPYKLLQQIGEGGFGVVFMAEQRKPVKRRVALKVIKQGMDTKQVIARFEAERQALALMDHPSIAKALDAGATELGRPYFVMELVKGTPITEFCDVERLNTKQRLDLFMDVCAAVQHAHQKGIIHRDLKPSNILVTLQDDKPLPKVIDFGIAKATQQELTEKTLFTRAEQFLGTPVYISPEQANLNAVDIDTRSDIYSLGVVLYELLTGKPPIVARELLSAGIDEMRRMIRDKETPKPSARITSLTAEEQSEIAKQRQLDPRKLGQFLRGDLDWILLKALEKERDRRYGTAYALRGDLERYLRDEPILASPPRASYRMRKFVRRNRLAVFGGTILLVSILAGIAGTAWQAHRAHESARSANQALAEKEDAFLAKSREEQRRFRQLREASRADHAAAVRMLDAGSVDEGLAHLERALRYDPGNQAALQRSLVALHPSTSTAHYQPRWQFRFDNSCVITLYSPDGSLLAGASANGQVNVLDPWTGSLRWTSKLEGGIYAMNFTPDGKYLVVGGSGILRLYDVDDGAIAWSEEFEPIAKQDLNAVVYKVKITPDSSRIFANIGSKTLMSFDSRNGSELWRIRFPDQFQCSLSKDGQFMSCGVYFSEPSHRIIRTSDGGEVYRGPPINGSGVYSPEGEFLAISIAGKHPALIDAKTQSEVWKVMDRGVPVAFSPDGTRLLSFKQWKDGVAVQMLDSADGQELWSLPLDGFLVGVEFVADGSRLAVATAKEGVYVLDSASGTKLYSSRRVGVVTLDISPDGTQFAWGQRDGSMHVLEASSGTETWIRNDGHYRNLTFAPDDSLLVSSGGRSGLTALDPSTGAGVWKSDHGKTIDAVAFSPDGTHIAASSYSTIWAYLSDGTEIWEVKPFKNRVTILEYVGDGSGLVGWSWGKTLRFMSAATGSVLWEDRFGSVDSTISLDPGGHKIAVGDGGKFLRVLDFRTGDELWSREYSKAHGFQSLCYLPERSDILAVIELEPVTSHLLGRSGGSSEIALLDATDGRKKWRVTTRGYVSGLAFSPSGELVVVGDSSGTLMALRTVDGSQTWRVTSSNSVKRAVFSPDGAYVAIATGSAGGSLDPDRDASQRFKVVDARTGAERWSAVADGDPWEVAFASTSLRIACGTFGSGALYVVDLASQEGTPLASVQLLRTALRRRAGVFFAGAGSLSPSSNSELESYPDVLHAAKRNFPTDPMIRALHWMESAPFRRTVSPGSSQLLQSAIADRLDALPPVTERWAVSGVRDAARRAPWHVLVPISLARVENEERPGASRRQEYLCRLTMERIRMADAAIWEAEALAQCAGMAAGWMIELAQSELAREAIDLALRLEPGNSRALEAERKLPQPQ